MKRQPTEKKHTFASNKSDKGFTHGTSGKESTCQCRRCKRQGFDPWVGKIPPEECMATNSNIHARRMPSTEEPGRLWPIGSQRDRHD